MIYNSIPLSWSLGPIHLNVSEISFSLCPRLKLFFCSIEKHFSYVSHFCECNPPSLILASVLPPTFKYSQFLQIPISWIHLIRSIFTAVPLIQVPIIFCLFFTSLPSTLPLAFHPFLPTTAKHLIKTQISQCYYLCKMLPHYLQDKSFG